MVILHNKVSPGSAEDKSALAAGTIHKQLIQERTRALRENTDFVSTLLESLVGYAIIAADFDGNIIAYNEGARKIYGYAPEEVIGKQNMEIFFPDDFIESGELQKIIGRLMEEDNLSCEGEKIRENGQRFPALVVFTVTKDKSGKMVGFIEIVQDLTGRKQAEEALRESQAHYKELAESISDVFFAFDENLKYTYWNKASEKLTGVPAKDALGKHLYDIFPDSEQTRSVEDVYKEVLRLKQPQHFLNEYRLDGKDFSFEIDAYPSKSGLSVFVKDVTERKRLEKRLWDSMSNFYKVINDNPDGIIITSTKGIVQYVNPAAELLFGRKSDYFKGEQFGFPITSGDTTEVDILRKAGEEVVAEMRVVETVWYDKFAYLISLHDITERKKSEEAIKSSELRYRRLFEAARDGILILNRDSGEIEDVNPYLIEILGYSREDFLGKQLWEIGVFKDVKLSKLAFDTLQSENYIRYEDLPLQAKDGKLVDVEFVSNVYAVDHREVIQCNIRNISERKKAQLEQERLTRQLQAQVSELEAFSYGIAHDLRSPLVSIEGFSRLLREDLESQKMENVADDIRLLESGVKRMQGFLSSTLEYSRSGHLIKRTKDVSFGEIVTEVMAEFNGQISSIGATVSLAKTFPKICVDRTRIKQVLTNLIQNSIKYRDKTVPLKIEIGHRLSEGEVVFFVRDNGLGIDASEAEKLFDLFYRGTADGGGSGVGLAIVKKIIEAHGGRIWIQEGQSGKGTTMCFTLPEPGGINKGDNNGKD